MSENNAKLDPAEVDALKQMFDAQLKQLVDDADEMSDLMNFTVAMIQNGKSVPEMEQELDDIYGGEYAKRIGVLLTDYFDKQKKGDGGDAGADETPEEANARVVSLKVSLKGEILLRNTP
jgi:hypothetical protein